MSQSKSADTSPFQACLDFESAHVSLLDLPRELKSIQNSAEALVWYQTYEKATVRVLVFLSLCRIRRFIGRLV